MGLIKSELLDAGEVNIIRICDDRRICGGEYRYPTHRPSLSPGGREIGSGNSIYRLREIIGCDFCESSSIRIYNHQMEISYSSDGSGWGRAGKVVRNQAL